MKIKIKFYFHDFNQFLIMDQHTSLIWKNQYIGKFVKILITLLFLIADYWEFIVYKMSVMFYNHLY